MDSKNMDFGSKDILSSLPDGVISHILSFLSTKEAASTSVLSKKWRYLFAFRPDLDFDDSVYLPHNRENDEMNTMFRNFVDRVLFLKGNSTVSKFSLKCGEDTNPVCVTGWISNALEHGVSDLDLSYTVLYTKIMLPKVFVSKSLVNLRMEARYCLSLKIDMEDFSLPNLKTLYLKSLVLTNGDSFIKFISGCQFLEELVLVKVYSVYFNRYVSSTTLKRLTLLYPDMLPSPPSVMFDTPNLVYLEYSDFVANDYTKVKIDSLVEASISIAMTNDQSGFASYENSVSHATKFLMGICNVQILHISAKTLEVLTYCCGVIPVFSSLNHLTIETGPRAGWESLLALLNSCPVLVTLVFQGLYHKETIKCEGVDGCLCNISSESHTCLASSPVKVIKVLKFGVSEVKKQIEQVKHFLKTMPNLEEIILYYNTEIKEDVFQVSNQLLKLPRVASPKCNVKVIADIIDLSVTVTLHTD